MKGKIAQFFHSRLELLSKKREWKKTGSLEQKGFWQRATAHASIVFLAAFAIAFLAASLIVPDKPAEDTNATTDTVSAGDYYVTLQTSDVSMNLWTVPTGATMTVVENDVSVSTNSPNGYKLYLGMSARSASGTLKPAADKLKNGLYLDGNLSRTDGQVIGASTGTINTQSGGLASLTDNTWGYAVDKITVGAPAIWASENHTTMSSAVPTDDKFAGVPVVGQEDLIQEISSVSGSAQYTDKIYYGIRATTAKTSGAYSNTIAYTAVSELPSDPSGDLTFSPTTYDRLAPYDTKVWNDTLTITTPIFTNMEDLGTASVTLSGGPDRNNRGARTCANPTLSVVNDMLTVSCTLPKAYAGQYDVVVNLPKFGQTYTGKYTYVVSRWSDISAMQEMNDTVCASAGSVTKSTNPVPEKFLTDLRGGGGHIDPTTGAYQATSTGKYRVRKYADGNCWMAENMDLPQSSTTTFYSWDTNLTKVPSTTFSNDSYTTSSDGTINWTPKDVDGTCKATSSGSTIPCSPNTISTAGPVDTNKYNAHSYNGNGSAGTRTADTVACPSSNTECAVVISTTETQSIGTYYNWAAATAQSGGNGTTGETGDDPAEAPNSFCPYGWRLPSGGANGTAKSFATLLTGAYGFTNSATGSIAARSYPVSLVLSGGNYWNNGQLYTQGVDGCWWSSSSHSVTNSYQLLVYSTYLGSQYSNDKLYGLSLRCVNNSNLD